jgi:hypothetical protein
MGVVLKEVLDLIDCNWQSSYFAGRCSALVALLVLGLGSQQPVTGALSLCTEIQVVAFVCQPHMMPTHHVQPQIA